MNNRTSKRQPNKQRSQNPGRRTQKKPQVPVNKKQQKKKVDPRQAEINRRNAERRNAERRKKLLKKKRAEARKLFFNRLLMFFVIFIVMLGMTIGLFIINLLWHPSTTSLSYTYQIGADDDSLKTTTYKNYDSLYIDGVIYINMSELAGIYDFIITGDNTTIRFIIPDENGDVGDDVKFVLNTTFAYVNGVQTRLSNAVYIRGTDVYVPMAFFTNYVSGFKVEYNEDKKKLTIYKPSDSKKIYFNLHLDEATEHISENSLSYELLYLTDPKRIAEPEPEESSGEIFE